MKKRLMSALLSGCMALTMFPTTALAANDGEQNPDGNPPAYYQDSEDGTQSPDGGGETSPAVELTGSVKVSTTNPTVGIELTAVYEGNAADVVYTWTIGEKTAVGSTYTVASEDVGKEITVSVSAEGYEGTVSASAGTAADVTAAVTVRPVISLDRKEFTWNGSVQQPAVTVAFNDNGTPVELTEGTDYTITLPESVDPGTYTVTVSPVEGSRYTFEEATATYTIIEAIVPEEKDPQNALTVVPSALTVEAGQLLTLSTRGGSTQGIVTYSIHDGTGSATLNNDNTVTAKHPGTFEIIATMAGNDKYQDVVSEPVTITVNQASERTTASMVVEMVKDRMTIDEWETAIENWIREITGISATARICNRSMVEQNINSYVTGETAYTVKLTTSPATNMTTLLDYFNVTSAPADGSALLDVVTPGDDGEYYISVSKFDNGSVVPSLRRANAGDRVTITAYPDSGYKLDTITVKDIRGREVTLRSLGDNKWNFIMPAYRVEVKAEFVKLEENTSNTADSSDNSVSPEDDVYNQPFTGLGTPGISGIVLNPAAMPFTDVHASDWFYNSVEYMWKHYLMSGTSENRFDPNITTSRAMIWTIMARMNNVRTDINPGSTWYERGMLWSMEQGITDGSDPMGDITREQLITMLWRSAGKPNASADTLSQFSDASSVSAYAQAAVRWAVGVGVLNGTDGRIDPQGTATRAQVAAMVARYGDKVATRA